MKVACFLIYPDAFACSYLPLYKQFGPGLLQKWLEHSLVWQKKIFFQIGTIEKFSFFVVVQEDDLRIPQIRKLFARKPAVPVKIEIAGPESFERRSFALFEKYKSRFDAILTVSPESPLPTLADYRKLIRKELDAIKTPQGRPLILTRGDGLQRVKTLPGLYDLRSISDILCELSHENDEGYLEVAGDVKTILQEFQHQAREPFEAT